MGTNSRKDLNPAHNYGVIRTSKRREVSSREEYSPTTNTPIKDGILRNAYGRLDWESGS
jgi:hypothetical protein